MIKACAKYLFGFLVCFLSVGGLVSLIGQASVFGRKEPEPGSIPNVVCCFKVNHVTNLLIDQEDLYIGQEKFQTIHAKIISLLTLQDDFLKNLEEYFNFEPVIFLFISALAVSVVGLISGCLCIGCCMQGRGMKPLLAAVTASSFMYVLHVAVYLVSLYHEPCPSDGLAIDTYLQ